MKIRNAIPTAPGLLAGLGLLSLGLDVEAAPKSGPVYSDIPGVTSPIPARPAQLVVQTNPAAAPGTPSTPAPAPAAPPAPVITTPAEPATPIDQTTGSKTLYSFQANDLDLKAALASFARANNLNIVPDNDVFGTVTLDVRDLPLDVMMRALLEASDCSWTRESGLIRVHTTETRTYVVDYLRLLRKGVGQNSAMLGSGTMGAGMGGGMAGGGGGMAGGVGGNGSAGSVFSGGSSVVNVTADNQIDFWKELNEEVSSMLTDSGKHSLAINKIAGIIQVSDRPSALKRVENYLKGVDTSSHRQVDIEAKLYDVTLNNQFQFGIDWVHLAEAYGGTLGFGGATLPLANGGSQLADSALGGINRFGLIGTSGSTTPGGNLSTLVFQNFNTSAAVNALKQQGAVEVISAPRLRTLNNQTALIKVGEEVPFFNTSTTIVPGTTVGSSSVLQQTIVNSITIGTILSITPQISGDDYVSLDISPVLTSLRGIITASGGGIVDTNHPVNNSSNNTGATAPDLDTKQASTLVRVKDGNTVVIGGLIQTQQAKNDTKIPVLGDIPLIGKLFTGTFRFKQKKELVIFVTPHIIRDGMEPAIPPMPPSPHVTFNDTKF